MPRDILFADLFFFFAVRLFYLSFGVDCCQTDRSRGEAGGLQEVPDPAHQPPGEAHADDGDDSDGRAEANDAGAGNVGKRVCEQHRNSAHARVHSKCTS